MHTMWLPTWASLRNGVPMIGLLLIEACGCEFRADYPVMEPL